MHRSRLIRFLLIGACLLYGALKVVASESEPYSGATSFSNRAGGLGIFAEFLQQIKGSDFRRERKPILDAHQLAGVGTFMTFSPKAPFSDREAVLLRDFVEDGGHLVVGIQSQSALPAVSALLRKFGVEGLSFERFGNFRNKWAIEFAVPKVEGGFLESLQTVTVYGQYQFEDSSGITKGFVEDKQVGRGTLTVLAGLAPVANAMIGRGGNVALATLIASQPGAVVLDESHHLFSERRVWDLLQEPSFFIPIGGMVLMVILFSLFGRLGVADNWDADPPAPIASSFHGFGQRLFRDVVMRSRARSAVIDEHAEFLMRIFPTERERIARVVAEPHGDWLAKGNQLAAIHLQLMHERGRLI